MSTGLERNQKKLDDQLWDAYQSRNVPLMEEALDQGANPYSERLDIPGYELTTIWIILHCGISAVADREREIVKMLIDRGVDIFRPNSQGKTISYYVGDNDGRVKEAMRLMNDKVERDRKREREERQQKVLQEEQAERDRLHLKEKILREQEAQEKARIQQEEEEARRAERNRIQEMEFKLKEKERILQEEQQAHEKARILREEEDQARQQTERNRIQEMEFKLKEKERILREKEEAHERARVLREEEEARLQIERRIQETELRLKQQEKQQATQQEQKRQENSGKEEEIDSKKITVGKKVGSGNFGEVYKGTWDGHPVALKRLADETQEFFKEIGTVKSIHHPNIVRFYGVARIDGKLNLVTEFCDGGSLSDHLRKLDDYSLSQRDAVAMGLGIARGVAALHEKKIIHRDLATRNVLISTERNTPVMKVADFGLSRKLQSSEYYNKMEIVLPVRWSAPEVLSTGKYSTASDVWSFGITLWEIYEQGALPYGGVGGQEVGQNIMSGMKLLRPDQCIDDQIWNIIENCWKSRMQRPTMDAIVKDLNRIYEDMPMSDG